MKDNRLYTIMESVHSEYESLEEVIVTPRTVSLKLTLFGESSGDFHFFALFNDTTILDGKWCDGLELKIEKLPLNLKEPSSADLVAQQPLLLILRSITKKGFDNKIGATVDLFPLFLGESDIFTQVHLVYIESGEYSGCSVEVAANAGAVIENRMPLVMTMVSAHCLPKAKEGTVYVSAIGFNDSTYKVPVNFGTSLSNVSYVDSEKVFWATASTLGFAASTGSSVPKEDFYVPPDLDTDDTDKCNSAYWHSMNRILIDSELLREQLQSPLLIQVAGLPKTGKGNAVRGHYMALLDAKMLLLPAVQGATFAAKLMFYKESDIPNNLHPVLNLPPSSARGSARHTNFVTDEYGHSAYVKIRLDVADPIIPKIDIVAYYEIIGQVVSESRVQVVDEPPVEPPPDEPYIDVRRLRKEGEALAVHKELTSLAAMGYIPMNQSIKRTAANQLLTSVKSLLKEFPPGECSHIEWQDTVTAHHAACRRAVTTSLSAQHVRNPPVRLVDVKFQVKEDTHADDAPIGYTLQQPTTLLKKALHSLETGKNSEARGHLVEALKAPQKNRFVLWAYGAQEFDRGKGYLDKTAAAFHVAIASDNLDDLTNTIGWAALHAVNHYSEQYEKAFIAALKMRRSQKLREGWEKYLKKWENTSGVEETFWMPQVISMQNPLIIAAAFFLCLRGYKLCERLLQCVHDGCSFRGTQDILRQNNTPDVNYIKSASLLLQRQFEEALKVTDEGITQFGPTPNLLQIRTSCLLCLEGWNGDCQKALGNAERAGAQLNQELFLQAAIGDVSSNPSAALQRAARAHKITPCARSALIIARIFDKMNNRALAERWAAAAVKLDPMNADGWGFLALFSMYDGDIDKAMIMLRTAKQAGPLQPYIKASLKELMSFIPVEGLKFALIKELCLC